MARHQQGYTLLELGIAVMVLGIIAAIALPSFVSNNDSATLDKAAADLAAAFAFARQESVYSGKRLGVVMSADGFTVIDSTGGSNTAVKNPLNKKDYIVRLPTAVTALHVTDAFSYETAGDRNTVLFDSRGQPHFHNGSNKYRLLAVRVALQLDEQQRGFSIAPVSGRVTLQ